MRGESVMSTTGARGAPAAVNAAGLQGHASSGGRVAPAACPVTDAQATTAAIVSRKPRMVTPKKSLGRLKLPKAVLRKKGYPGKTRIAHGTHRAGGAEGGGGGGGASAPGAGDELEVPTTSISTRRFLARPAAVLLLATGWLLPLPSV